MAEGDSHGLAAKHDDIIFIDPLPETFKCPVCISVLNDPHLLSCCGVHICEECIKPIKANRQPCPWCRNEDYVSLLNKATRRTVQALKVRCENISCDWVGALGELEKHLTSKCLYVQDVCRHGCGASFPRGVLEVHERDDCPSRPTDARITSLRKMMNERLSTIETKYDEEILYLKRQLAEQEKRHLKEIKEIKKEVRLGSLAGERGVVIPEWQLPLPTSTHVLPPCFFTMVNYSDHKSKDDHYFAPPFYTHPCGYKFCLRVNANGDGSGKRTHISLFVYVMKGEYDADLEWPFYGDMTLQLLNWREDKSHIEKTLPFDDNVPEDYNSRQIKYLRGKGWGYQEFAKFDRLKYNSDTNTEYLRSDTLCFRVSKVIVKSK